MEKKKHPVSRTKHVTLIQWGYPNKWSALGLALYQERHDVEDEFGVQIEWDKAKCRLTAHVTDSDGKVKRIRPGDYLEVTQTLVRKRDFKKTNYQTLSEEPC